MYRMPFTKKLKSTNKNQKLMTEFVLWNDADTESKHVWKNRYRHRQIQLVDNNKNNTGGKKAA